MGWQMICLLASLGLAFVFFVLMLTVSYSNVRQQKVINLYLRSMRGATEAPVISTFKLYSLKAASFAVYPNLGENYNYPFKGLVGEVGELAEKLKKLERDFNITTSEKISVEARLALKKELGDILWYWNQLSLELDVTGEEVATLNIQKLVDRAERGMLHGSGDNR